MGKNYALSNIESQTQDTTQNHQLTYFLRTSLQKVKLQFHSFHLPLTSVQFQILANHLNQCFFLMMMMMSGSIFWAMEFIIRILKTHRDIPQVYSWLWNCNCQLKHKIILWLFLKDRLNTRELLRRKNMVLPSYSCFMSSRDVDESSEHLFLQCPFSQQCWAWAFLVSLVAPTRHLRFQSLYTRFLVTLLAKKIAHHN